MTVTVAEAMNLPIMQQARLVAGRSGIGRQIRWVTIVEVIDDVSRLQEGEFLITTAYGWETDAPRARQLIECFAQRKLSGVAFLTGVYLAAIPGHLAHLADELELPLLELPSNLNFSMVTRELLEQVVNEQFRALEYSENVHQRLIHLALSNSGLDSIVSELAQLTQGVIQVYNPEWEVTAGNSASGDQDFQTDLRQSLLSELDANPREKDQLLNDRKTVRLRLGSSAAAALAGDGADRADDSRRTIWRARPMAAAVAPMVAHSETLGYMLLAKPTSVTDLDLLALGHACTVCALELIKQEAIADAESRLKADFVAELLQGNPAAVPAQLERAASFGIDTAKAHAVAVVTTADESPTTVRAAWQAIEQALLGRGVKYLAKRSPNFVQLLVEQVPEVELKRIMEEAMAGIRGASAVRIGFGCTREGLEHLALSAREARLAARFGPVLHGYAGVAASADLAPYRLFIDMRQRDVDLAPYYGAALEPLLCRPALLRTLDALLWHNMNLKLTAESLYIHRHTLKYRLQKIERVTGCRMDNPHQRFQLQTAIIAYKVQQAADGLHAGQAGREASSSQERSANVEAVRR